MAQPAPKPGQMRLWTYQSIAHGADMVLYFRWRTATMGTEIYWHGINDYHNRPNRRVAEAAQIGREVERIGELVAGSRVAAQVAIVGDYDNEWDGELDSWHGPYTWQSVYSWFAALQYRHIPVDAVYLRTTTTLSDLANYRVLIYPHLAIMSDATGELLTEYVRQGGTVIFGARTGYKDTTGQVPMRPLPGPVADLCGVTVADYTRIGPLEAAPALRWGDRAIIADAFNDILALEAPDAVMLAEYAGGYYAGAPALVRRNSGAGRAYYYGAVFNVPAAMALIDECGIVSPAADWLELPQAVELGIRERADGAGQVIFLLNYSADAQTALVRERVVDAFSGDPVQGDVALAPYAVRVLLR
jgi:beta-galactosidase